MAVEIKELVIRAIVDYPDTPQRRGNESLQQSPDSELNSQSKLVQACVKEVLKVLKRERKR